jgi:oxygen-independent coproporphyrinogen-3 oxidase
LSQTAPTAEQVLALAEKLDVRGPRYTSYPTVPVWGTPFPAAPFERALDRLREERRRIAVYLHLPFCRSRCFYCGCNSFITRSEQRMERYVEALALEIERVAERLAGAVQVAELHLGGGTPTHLPLALLAWLLDGLETRLPAADDRSRSVEVDPRVTSDQHLRLLAQRGFRRISAGVQDLEPRVQEAVRREYRLDDLARFIGRARAAGFTGVNVDLIYGLPLQTVASWRATLRAVAALCPDRLACFAYAHLPDRFKHQRAIDPADLPSARARIAMLLGAGELLSASGYERIGLDHFALPGDPLVQAYRNGTLERSFMGYTASAGLELLAFGCSAISELDDLYVQNVSLPEIYAARIRAGRSAIDRGHRLDDDDRYRRAVIGDLMCNLRVRLQAPRPGLEPSVPVEPAMRQMEAFVRDGLLVENGAGYRVTELGRLFLRNIAMPFDRYLPAAPPATFSKAV